MSPLPIVAAAGAAVAKGGAGVAAATKAGAAMAKIKPGTWKTIQGAFDSIKDTSTPLESLQRTFNDFGAVLQPVELFLRPITALFQIMSATMTEAMMPAIEQFTAALLDPEVISMVKQLGTNLGEFFSWGVQKLAEVMQWMIEERFFARMEQGLKFLGSAFTFFVGVLGTARNIVRGIVLFFANVIDWFRRVFFAFLGLFDSHFRQSQYTTPMVPALAEGGIVNRPTLALIGEAGPEKVVPLNKFDEGAGGGTIHVHVGTLVATDGGIQEFKKRMARVL
jgi:hypothetical protein